jgi:hypothetical protein
MTQCVEKPPDDDGSPFAPHDAPAPLKGSAQINVWGWVALCRWALHDAARLFSWLALVAGRGGGAGLWDDSRGVRDDVDERLGKRRVSKGKRHRHRQSRARALIKQSPALTRRAPNQRRQALTALPPPPILARVGHWPLCHAPEANDHGPSRCRAQESRPAQVRVVWGGPAP